jgi:hypothetical protein
MEFFEDFDTFDDNSSEDNLEEDLEMDEPNASNSESDDEIDQPESDVDELDVDPFLIGGAMGYAFGEGMRERKRKKRKKRDDELD